MLATSHAHSNRSGRLTSRFCTSAAIVFAYPLATFGTLLGRDEDEKSCEASGFWLQNQMVRGKRDKKAARLKTKRWRTRNLTQSTQPDSNGG